MENLYDAGYKVTMNKEESVVAFYGISPYWKSFNNMPLTKWETPLKVGDTLIFTYSPSYETLSIQSKERRFEESIRYIPKDEIYRPVFWQLWKDQTLEIQYL